MHLTTAARRRPRPARFWPRALPAAARHVAAPTPWVTLLAGCLTGTVLLVLLAYVARHSHQPLSENVVRLTFLPAVAALAFVPRDPLRPLTQAAPAPGWLTSAGQTLLAVPVLAATCWAQLLLMDHTAAPLAPGPAVYPLLAQLTGSCAVAVAAAACCDRSRYADLGGAVAAPVSLAVIALAWYGPRIGRLLVTPPAATHAVTIAWYAIAAAALILTAAAMRDRWHRYPRPPRRAPRGGAALREGT